MADKIEIKELEGNIALR